MRDKLTLSPAGQQKANLAMARWGHHDFLKAMVGKKVLVETHDGYLRAVLIAYDNYSLGLSEAENGEIDMVTFKSAMVLITPYDPAEHDELFEDEGVAV